MRTVTALALAIFLAACGDNLSAPDAGGDDTPPTPDARPGTPDGTPAIPARAVIVSGDFATTGILSTLDLPERAMDQGAVDGVAGVDPVIRHIGDELFVVNRAGGANVTILTDDTLTLVDQIATGPGAGNPQDVAMVGDKMYVAALDATGVIVFDRANGNARTVIDLSDLDIDNHPNCVSVYSVGPRLFVACGVLNPMSIPRGPGVVAVIDTTGDTVLDTLTLPAANPFSLFARTPATSVFAGDLVIGTVPSFTDFATGCLARVTIGPTPAANGCAATNMELGGYVNHVEPSPDGLLLWVAVDGFTPTFDSFGSLKAIDMISGELWEWPVSLPDQVIVDLAVCPGPGAGGVVVAADAGATKGMRLYENGAEITTAPMPIGLPPAYGGNTVCFAR